MSTYAYPRSLFARRRTMITIAVVAALVGSVAVTSSAAVAVDTVVHVATITTAQTEVRIDRVLTIGADDIFGLNTTSSSYLQVEFENFTDTPETFGLAGDFVTAGVEQRAWLPETWSGEVGDISEFFSVQIGANLSGRSELDGFLPDWPGETYGFYRIAIDDVTLAEPELVGSFTNSGTHVRLDLNEPSLETGIGQVATFDDSAVYPGADTVAKADGLNPGEQLGLWLSPGIDYFAFLLTGARLAENAVYAGEGFVAADGNLTATLAVPPNLALGGYQLLVGNPDGRNWPAGTVEPIQVVAAPEGTVLTGSAVVGPTVDSPVVTKTFDSTSTGVNLDFGNAGIVTPGVTTATVSATGPTVDGFSFATDPPTYYYLHTTATFTGLVEVCVSYDPAVITDGPFDLLHYVNGAWETLAPGPSAAEGLACGMTDSFSPFVLAKPLEVTLTNKQECKNGGWATSTNPEFANQGQCVKYFTAEQHHQLLQLVN